MIENDDPRPLFLTPRIAGRLLDFTPPTAINRYREQHPSEFPNSTKRLFSVEDLDCHPRRQGKPITAMEILRIDREQAEVRAVWRRWNARRKANEDAERQESTNP